MPTGHFITTDDVASMRALRAAGVTRRSVAARLGVSYQTVVRYTRTRCHCSRIPGVAAFFWDAGAA